MVKITSIFVAFLENMNLTYTKQLIVLYDKKFAAAWVEIGIVLNWDKNYKAFFLTASEA